MNSVIDRLRHGLFDCNKFAARDKASFTRLMSSASSRPPGAPSFQRLCRKLSMCLNAIVFMLKFESSNKMPASQKKTSHGEARTKT